MSIKDSAVLDGKVVAIDLDNVICNSDPKIREVIKQISSISLVQDEITNYEYSRALINRGIESRAAKQIFEEAIEIFHDSECLNVEPLEGALEGIYKFLDAGLEIVIPASRPGTCQRNTESWLSSFAVPCSQLLFLDEKAREAHNWAFLIEDAVHHANAVCKIGVPVCLLDYPWNKESLSTPLIYRAKNWPGIVEFVSRVTL